MKRVTIKITSAFILVLSLNNCTSQHTVLTPEKREKISQSSIEEYDALIKEDSEINRLHKHAEQMISQEFSKMDNIGSNINYRGGSEDRFSRVVNDFRS